MSQGQPTSPLRYLHTVLAPAADEAAMDGGLLQRFVRQHEEGAFAALVRRHGPMVLGVCRRVLNDAGAAEDAFQATFLVLARKAATIRKQDSVAGWLCRVAYRVARSAKAQAARQRALERQWVPMPPPAELSDVERHELRAILDEEVNRLPAKYHAPLVLCYLEEKTHEEAAHRLRWPVGTVKGRLARARELLRGRLARRGLTLTAGLFASELGRTVAPAAVSPLLIIPTVRAAVAFAAEPAVTGAAVSTRAAALAQGVLQSMWKTKFAVGAVVTLAVSFVLGGGILAYRALANPPATAISTTPAQAAAKEAEKPQAKSAPAKPIKLEPARRMKQDGFLGRLAFSPDRKVLASTNLPEVTFWDWTTGKMREQIRWGLDPDKDKKYPWFQTTLREQRDVWNAPFFVFSLDRKIKVTAARMRFFNPPARGDNRGQRGTAEVKVQVIDMALAKVLHEHIGKGTCIARMGDYNEPWATIAPDARSVVIRDETGFWLWDTGTGKPIVQLHPQLKDGRGPLTHPMTFSRDGTLLLFNKSLWEVATGKPLADINAAFPVLFSADNKVLAAGLPPTTTGLPLKAEEIGVVLLYDLAGSLRKVAGIDPQKLGPKEQAKLWTGLGDPEASRAYPMVAVLVAAGNKAVAILKQRLPDLVKKGEELRRLRAVVALEQIGSAPARFLLKAIAEQAPDARAVQSAKDALARLAALRTDAKRP
jgi:RNA polymerase sigma factor (sigma-70 family)